MSNGKNSIFKKYQRKGKNSMDTQSSKINESDKQKISYICFKCSDKY